MSETLWLDCLTRENILNEGLQKAAQLLDEQNVLFHDISSIDDLDTGLDKVKSIIGQTIWDGLDDDTRSDIRLLFNYFIFKEKSKCFVLVAWLIDHSR